MRARRFLKVAGYALGGTILLILVLILGAWGAANTQPGRDFLRSQAKAALESAGFEAEIEGLAGPLPQRLALDRLVLRDGEGAWLALEQAEISWRPLALLTGQLRIAAITAERLAIPRLPAGGEPAEAPPEEESEPFSIPEPPVSVRIETLRLERIELGEPVIGQAATFRVAGQAAAPAAGELRTDLEVVRLDDPGGEVTLSAGYAPDGQRLSVDLRVSGAAGGLLAGALDLSEAAEVSARLRGDGPLTDWEGNLQARLGPEARVDAVVGIQGASTLTLDGRAEVLALLPANARPLVGGAFDVRLRASQSDFARFRLERADIATPTTALELTGSFDGDAGTVQAAGEIRLKDPGAVNAMIAPAELSGVAARFSARGPVGAPATKVTLTADKARTAEAAIEKLRAELDYAPDSELLRGRAKLEVTGERTGLNIPALAGYDGAPLALSFDSEVDLNALRFQGLTGQVELADTALNLNGDADLSKPRARLGYRLAAPRLARFDPAVQLGLAGRGTLSGELIYGGAETLLDATLQAEFTDLAWAEAVVQALAGGSASLDSRIVMTDDGSLSVSGLELSTGAATVGGDITFPADFASLDGTVRASLPDLKVLQDALNMELAGLAEARAKLSGPLADPAVTATVTGADLSAAGNAVDSLSVDADASQLASGARGRVALKARGTPAGPLDARTDFALSGQTFEVRGFRADLEGLRVADGRLDLPLGGGAMQGGADIEADDLARLGERFDVPLAGGGTVKVRLAKGRNGQAVRVDGTLSAIALDDADVRADEIRVAARVDDALGTPRGTAEVSLSNAAAGPATMRTAKLTVEGNPTDATVELEAEGEAFGPVRLDTRARVRPDADTLRVDLERFVAVVQNREISLAQPATLRRTGDTLSVQGVRLAAGGGSLALDVEKTARTVDATLRGSKLPINLVNLALAEPKLSGTLDAEIDLNGPLDAPTGRLQVGASQVEAAEADLPPFDASLSGRLADGRLSADAEIAGMGEAPVRITGVLPVALSLQPFTAEVQANAPLRASLDWQGKVAPLMPFVPVAGHRLTGNGEIALDVRGTLDDPRPQGFVTLRDAVYENLEAGTLLTDLQLRVEGDGEKLRLVELTAEDGGNGRITGSGHLDIQPLDAMALDLTIEAKDAKLVRRDEVSADTNLGIAIKGPLNDLLIEGKVKVVKAEVRIPNSMPPEVASLDVVEADSQEGEAGEEANGQSPESAEEGAPPAKIALDIDVEIPNQLFLRGRGLDTEWSGNLRVTGTASKPVVTGEIVSVRGRIDALSKTFQLQTGRVEFDGGDQIDPRIMTEAVYDSENLQVVVSLEGPAQQPELTLSSRPELPQDEILARLLFGESAAELSPLEAAQLAAAVAELSGATGSGPGILDRVRRFAGVDVLRLSGEGEATSVTAGKYLSEDVFVGVNQGMGTESSEVTVEVDITDNIAVESNVGATGQSDVGIQFKWDY